MRSERLVKQLFRCVWVIFYCLAQLCYCQSSADCGTKGVTRTIEAQSDATAIASCTVFSGSIALATAPAVSGTLSIDGIQEILEDLVVQNIGSLTSFGGKDLRRINGNFIYRNLTLISTTNFPVLSTVGTISFVALPSSPNFDFSAGITSVANVTISNTFLSTLEGINLKNADVVQIDNNLRLRNITLPLETAKIRITMSANAVNAQVNLPQLTSAGSIILRNISTIYMPSLSFLSGNLSLQSSYMTNFSADSLSVITQDLYLQDNARLMKASFAGLLSVSSMEITNNSVLANMTFEKMSRAERISFNGKFSSIDMPGLTSVNRTFTIQTTDPKFNCSIFDSNKARSIIKGDYRCQGTHQALVGTTTQAPSSVNTATNLTTNPTNTGVVSNGQSGLSTGAKAGIGVSSAAAALLAIGGIIVFLRRKSKKPQSANAEEQTFAKPEMDGTEKPRTELGGGKVHELHEQDAIAEMSAKAPAERIELPGDNQFVPLEMGEGEGRSNPTENNM